MNPPVRLVAKVNARPSDLTVKHYRGFPPALTGGADRREAMVAAAFLVIEEKASGWFLVRFTADGSCVGDTWHMSVNEAKDQAIFEFGNGLSEWEAIPSAESDAIAFYLRRCRGQPT